MSAARPRRWLLLLPLLAGVAILILLVQTRERPVQAPPGEIARVMRVIPVPSVAVLPRARGFGTVQPDTVWQAVAQVSGSVVERHPELKNGVLLPADTLLLKIDTTDYRLALARTGTSIRETEARLDELAIREENIRAALAIEAEALDLSEQELERNRRLAAQGTLSQAELGRQARETLAQRQSVQNQQNALNLIPAERELLQAQLARYEAQREQDLLNLARTEVRLPFDARIGEVAAQRGEYVRQGELLVSADSIGVAEVLVRLPLGRVAPLLHGQRAYTDVVQLDTDQLREAMGLSARVQLPGDLPVSWQARLDRVSDTLDPATRTVGLVLAVDAPYEGVQPGVRPPLIKGMFVAVELRGQPRPDTLVIPRAALHQDRRVYLADEENRLQARQVELGFGQGEFVTVTAGLEAGERLVVSDPVPAIEGMLLEPRVDETLLARLVAEASGEALP